MAMLGKFRNTNAFRTLKEYSECATVHGISYIFEKVEPDMFLTLNTEGVLGPPLTEDCRGGGILPAPGIKYSFNGPNELQSLHDRVEIFPNHSHMCHVPLDMCTRCSTHFHTP